jgi:hypothetical protein
LRTGADCAPLSQLRLGHLQVVARIGAGAHSLNTGLLGRPWRPSVARTASSLEWLIAGSATTLFVRAAASFKDGRTGRERASRGVPGSGMCRTRHAAGRVYRHIPYPARPEEGRPSQ